MNIIIKVSPYVFEIEKSGPDAFNVTVTGKPEECLRLVVDKKEILETIERTLDGNLPSPKLNN